MMPSFRRRGGAPGGGLSVRTRSDRRVEHRRTIGLIIAVLAAGSTAQLRPVVLHAQSLTYRHVSVPLSGGDGDVLSNLAAYGIAFDKPVAVVSIPRPGYARPADTGTDPGPAIGICAIGASGVPDCHASLTMRFLNGANNVQFDVAGGYSDSYCYFNSANDGEDAKFNVAADAAHYSNGFFDTAVLSYRWTAHKLFSIPTVLDSYIDHIDVSGSWQTNTCGLGVNDVGAHPGGIALSNIEFDEVVKPGVLPLDVVDPACQTATSCPGIYVNDDGSLIQNVTALSTAPVVRTGAVADGVTKLLLRVRSATEVTFHANVAPILQALDPGSLETLDGTKGTVGTGTATLTVQPAPGTDWVFAVYRVPLDFIDPSITQATVTFDAISGGPLATATTSIKLLRPLTMMVHGVWSNPTDAWTGFKNFLAQNSYQVCDECLVDYSAYGGAPSFDPFEPSGKSPAIAALVSAELKALKKLHASGIAASQVDVVAHSMGGLVTRARAAQPTFYSKRNYNRGEFHKIITIGTPHHGSELADWLIANRCDIAAVPVFVKIAGVSVPVVVPQTLEQFFAATLDKPIGAAIYGFQTGSPDLRNIGATGVASHAIVGNAPALSSDEVGLNAIPLLFGHPEIRIDDLLGKNEPNWPEEVGKDDTIVSAASQRGGLPEPNDVSRVEGVTHSGIVYGKTNGNIGSTPETASFDTWQQVYQALLARVPQSSPAFEGFPAHTTGGAYTAPSSCSGSILSSQTSASSQSTPNVALDIQPVEGTVFHPGESVPVVFTITGGDPSSAAFMRAGNILNYVEASNQFSMAFDVGNRAGRVDIIAQTVGATASYQASTYVNVVPLGTPTRLAAAPHAIELFSVGERARLTISATYPAGDVDVTLGTAGTTYSLQSGSNAVVTVSSDGLVEAVGAGADTIVVNHNGLTTLVGVIVTISNRPPVLSGLSDVVMPAGSARTIAFTAADPDGNPIHLVGSTMPPFATLSDRGQGAGELTLNPAVSDAGTYSIWVAGVDAGDPPAEGIQTISITVTMAPAIRVQPLNQHLVAGQSTAFSIDAVAVPSPAYQWQRMNTTGAWLNLQDDATYAGATSETLTILNAPSSLDGAQYRCIATNALGSVASSPATLSVLPVGTGPGRFDATFGQGGRVTMAIAGYASVAARAAALQSDGKIVVVGQALRVAGDYRTGDFAIVRVNPDGTPDSTFGVNGAVTTDFYGLEDGANAVALQSDGRIVAAGLETGQSYYGFGGTALAVVRYLPNGTLDPAFGTGGKVVTVKGTSAFADEPFDVCESLVQATAVAIQPDGRIVVVGGAWDGYLLTSEDVALVRYNEDGTLDPSLKPNMVKYLNALTSCGAGVRVLDIGDGGLYDHATSVVVRANGSILMGGDTAHGGSFDSMILGFTADGVPDPSFGTGGVSFVPPPGSGTPTFLSALRLQPDGHVVSAGRSVDIQLGQVTDAFLLRRYQDNGTLDSTLNGVGQVESKFPPGATSADASDVIVEPNGRIVVAGSAGDANVDFAIARYTPTGYVDGVFNDTGFVTTDFFGRTDTISTILLQSDGHLVAVGNAAISDTALRIAVARYESGGLCHYDAALWFPSLPAAGGFEYGNVTAPSGCAWTSTSNVSWLHLDYGASGVGNGEVRFTVDPNPTTTMRVGTATLAGITLTVNQAASTPTCSYSVPPGASVGAAGGSLSVPVATGPACNWSATSTEPWLTIRAGAGTGNGTVSYTVAVNTGTGRSGAVLVGGRTFTVVQAPAGTYRLFWQHQGTGALSAWDMNGTTLVAGQPVSPSPVTDTNWKIVGSADFDGDGQPDLLWQHQVTRLMTIWLMNGTTFRAAGLLSNNTVSDTRWLVRAIADMNGDGHPDLIWQHQTEGWLVVWFLNGTTLIGSSFVSPNRVTDPNWRIAAAADFNGDGQPDLLWQNAQTGLMTVWLMNGVSFIAPGLISNNTVSDTNWKIKTVLDVNGDGKPDFIWHHQKTGALAVWFMDGTTFLSGHALTPPAVSDTGWQIVAPR